MSEGLPYADMGRGIHRSPWNCTDSSRTQTTNQRIKVSKNYELKESFLPIEKNLFWSQKCGSTKFAWSCSLWRNEDIQQVSEFVTKKRLFESVANKEKSDKNFWKRKPVFIKRRTQFFTWIWNHFQDVRSKECWHLVLWLWEDTMFKHQPESITAIHLLMFSFWSWPTTTEIQQLTILTQ